MKEMESHALAAAVGTDRPTSCTCPVPALEGVARECFPAFSISVVASVLSSGRDKRLQVGGLVNLKVVVEVQSATCLARCLTLQVLSGKQLSLTGEGSAAGPFMGKYLFRKI